MLQNIHSILSDTLVIQVDAILYDNYLLVHDKLQVGLVALSEYVYKTYIQRDVFLGNAMLGELTA